VRRAVVYLVLAVLAGLVGGVSLSGELSSDITPVDAVIVGTHTGRIRGANGGSNTVYYVDVERQDTFERESVRNAPFYDAYEASGDTHVVLDVLSTDPNVQRIAQVHYLGHTYAATTKAEGVGVSIAFLVLALLFFVLGVRRIVVTRRNRSGTGDVGPMAPAGP
jgi:hypothetical protein